VLIGYRRSELGLWI